jgi:nucleoside-diphosphate-sugar epimerase
MRIFVTGGTGFIGSHFVKLAMAVGHEVHALRRAGSRSSIKLDAEPHWIDGQLDSDFSLVLEGCDVLLHFAAQGVSPQATNWTKAFDCNVAKSLALIENALKCGVPKIIACGSCMEFGQSGERFDSIPPNAPLLPIGPYASSKAAFSFALESLARTIDYDASFHLLRPFHIYGSGQHESNFWPSLRSAALAGRDFPMTMGEQVRDFIEVKEVACEFLRCAEQITGNVGFYAKNIGSGNAVKLRDFAEYWWKTWNAKGELQFGELPYRDNEIMRFVPQL